MAKISRSYSLNSKALKPHLKQYIFPAFIAFFLIFLFAMASYFPGNDLRLRSGDVTPLNDGWLLTYADGTNEVIDLPRVLNIPQNQKVIIKKELPQPFHSPQTIRLRSSMQHIEVYLEGVMVFDNNVKEEKGPFFEPKASAWYMVDLPGGSQEKQLEIAITSELKVMSGRINSLEFGEKSDLINALVDKNLTGIIIAFFILVIGCLGSIFSLIIRMESIKRLGYLSIFAFTISIWLISEIDIMQMFTGNSYIIGAISYWILPLAVMSFMLFVKEVALGKYYKVINAFVAFFAIGLISSILLQMIINLHFIDWFKFFNPMMLVAGLLILFLLVYESLRFKNKIAIKYTGIIGVIVFTTLIEVYKFIFGDFMTISYFSSYGILLFFLLLLIDTFKYVNSVLQKEVQTRYLEEIAYKDILTGAPNRSAFEKRVDSLLKNNDKVPFRLIIFDLNYLKIINDQHGHSIGDEALKDFYQALLISYGETSDCYRVGGDEFMVIQRIIDANIFKESQLVLERHMNEIEAKKEYSFKCAYGSDVYYYNQNFSEFKHEVDMKMYDFKKAQKKSRF